MKLTPTEILFNDNKQDWFISSLGFHHKLVRNIGNSIIMRVRCPYCNWSVISNNPEELAYLEEKHIEYMHKLMDK